MKRHTAIAVMQTGDNHCGYQIVRIRCVATIGPKTGSVRLTRILTHNLKKHQTIEYLAGRGLPIVFKKEKHYYAYPWTLTHIDNREVKAA